MSLRKRLAGIAVAVALLVGGLTVADTPLAPVESAAAAPNCGGAISSYHNGGNVSMTPNISTMRGVKARIHGSGKLELCNGSFTNSSSVWIAVVPAPGNPQYGNSNAILQVGFWLDHDIGVRRIFWARGGCNGNLPFAQYNIAPAGHTPDTSWYGFDIHRLSGGSWTVSYSSESGSGSGFLTIAGTNAAVGCWLNDEVRGQVSTEFKDARDSAGFSDAHMYIRDIRFQASTEGTWWRPSQLHSSGAQMGYPVSCDFRDSLPDGGGYTNQQWCEAFSELGTLGDKMDLWTTH